MQNIIEYQQLFFEEVRSYLIELEDSNSNRSNILHTIKGMASTMDYNYLADLCHDFETELNNSYQDINSYYERLNVLKNTVNLLEQGTKEEELCSPSKIQDNNSLVKFSSKQIQNICFELDEIIQEQHDVILKTGGANSLQTNSRLRVNNNKLKSLQEKLINSQLISLGELLKEQKSSIQELATKLNKKVSLKIQGQNTSIPQSIYKEVKEILLHTLRNAIYHGIESPETRKSINKKETGEINIQIKNQNNKLIISVQDDGQGLDNSIQDNNIIFTESFSTENNINQTAGRGLGLYIVKENLQAINGTYNIKNITNELFKLEFNIPVDIALTECLVYNLGDYNIAIPCNYISQENSILLTEDEQLNIINLNNILGIKKQKALKSFLEIKDNYNNKYILEINNQSKPVRKKLLTQPYILDNRYHTQENIIEAVSVQRYNKLTLILNINKILS